ncbi:hypothetical protein AW024_23945 [Shigella sonnei]|nr:hypothetical protein AW024_23945 [Shigella sonnei]
MIKMAEHLKGYWPNQLSFSESCGMVMRMLMTLQGASPGRIPELMRDLASVASRTLPQYLVRYKKTASKS